MRGHRTRYAVLVDGESLWLVPSLRQATELAQEAVDSCLFVVVQVAIIEPHGGGSVVVASNSERDKGPYTMIMRRNEPAPRQHFRRPNYYRRKRA